MSDDQDHAGQGTSGAFGTPTSSPALGIRETSTSAPALTIREASTSAGTAASGNVSVNILSLAIRKPSTANTPTPAIQEASGSVPALGVREASTNAPAPAIQEASTSAGTTTSGNVSVSSLALAIQDPSIANTPAFAIQEASATNEFTVETLTLAFGIQKSMEDASMATNGVNTVEALAVAIRQLLDRPGVATRGTASSSPLLIAVQDLLRSPGPVTIGTHLPSMRELLRNVATALRDANMANTPVLQTEARGDGRPRNFEHLGSTPDYTTAKAFEVYFKNGGPKLSKLWNLFLAEEDKIGNKYSSLLAAKALRWPAFTDGGLDRLINSGKSREKIASVLQYMSGVEPGTVDTNGKLTKGMKACTKKRNKGGANAGELCSQCRDAPVYIKSYIGATAEIRHETKFACCDCLFDGSGSRCKMAKFDPSDESPGQQAAGTANESVEELPPNGNPLRRSTRPHRTLLPAVGATQPGEQSEIASPLEQEPAAEQSTNTVDESAKTSQKPSGRKRRRPAGEDAPTATRDVDQPLQAPTPEQVGLTKSIATMLDSVVETYEEDNGERYQKVRKLTYEFPSKSQNANGKLTLEIVDVPREANASAGGGASANGASSGGSVADAGGTSNATGTGGDSDSEWFGFAESELDD